MKALERDPEVRYQDAGDMLRDLERVLHEWQPATATGLVRFLEILFDEHERGDSPRPKATLTPTPAPASTSRRSTSRSRRRRSRRPRRRPRTRCPSRSCSSGSASSRGGRLHMALSKEQAQFYQRRWR